MTEIFACTLSLVLLHVYLCCNVLRVFIIKILLKINTEKNRERFEAMLAALISFMVTAVTMWDGLEAFPFIVLWKIEVVGYVIFLVYCILSRFIFCLI